MINDNDFDQGRYTTSLSRLQRPAYFCFYIALHDSVMQLKEQPPSGKYGARASNVCCPVKIKY